MRSPWTHPTILRRPTIAVLSAAALLVACRDFPEATAPSRPPADVVVAPPLCGIVTTNTNLSGDCLGPLVVAASGITVNLGGHAVTCGPVPNPPTSSFGIEILGQTNDHVTNGEVENCYFGIKIFQGGGHELSNLNVHNHGFVGIALQASSNNDIRNTISSANTVFGVQLAIRAAFNRLDHLQIEQNAEGIRIDGGSDNNVVTSSFLLSNAPTGINIFGDNNTIDQSTTVRQSAVGIAVSTTGIAATGNTIRATSASQNDLYGIFLSAGATNTTIQSSDASNNGLTGIYLFSGATSNRIMSNKAFGNGSDDLVDDNLACDTNTWKSNQFGTANQTCIS